MTPLGAVARGLAAGLAGTAVMTVYQVAVQKLQSSGSDDSQNGDQSWQDAPAPAQVGRRVLTGVFRQRVDEDKIPVLTHGVHWAYGTALGVLYGLAQGTLRAHPLRHGLAFGTGVWGLAYAQLVPMGVYEPPWKYPAKDLAVDWSYHAAYGIGVGAAFSALDGGGRDT